MMTLIARTISLGDATKEKTTEPAKDGDKKMFGHLVVVLNKYELKPNPEISAALTWLRYVLEDDGRDIFNLFRASILLTLMKRSINS